MTTFIRIEYLIANAFIYSDVRYITTDKIFNYQRVLMNYWNKEKIDALIFGSLSTIPKKEFNAWFTIFFNAGLIVLNDDITKDMLKQKFVLLDDQIQDSFSKNASALL